MSSNALYTDLSAYYDLMCADIDYQAQSHCVRRLHQLFGNQGRRHLDLACGTGPHVRHFLDFGYRSRQPFVRPPHPGTRGQPLHLRLRLALRRRGRATDAAPRHREDHGGNHPGLAG